MHWTSGRRSLQLKLDFGDAQRFQYLLRLHCLHARDTWDVYRALRWVEPKSADIAWVVAYMERTYGCGPGDFVSSELDENAQDHEEDVTLWTTPDTYAPAQPLTLGNPDVMSPNESYGRNRG